MSSMRNAVQRRNHKERAQPVEREKWGVLEKHRDYSLRAKDYNEKKKRLKILREKAAERNPDEFHFAMMSSKTDKSGRKIADRGNKSLSTVAVKLLKTQDAGYLRTMAQQTRRAREKLEEEFILDQGDGVHQSVTLSKKRCDVKGPQHLRFVKSREEQKAFDLGQVEEGETKVVPPGRPSLALFDGPSLDSEADVNDSDVPAQHRPNSKRSTEAQTQLLKANRAIRKRRKKQHEARTAKLETLRKREKDLMAAEYELELQRAKMSSSIGGVTKAGLKWKVRERKR
ncbi:MAG: hypothetical protein Q9187_006348 [Circinaria calcarea]